MGLAPNQHPQYEMTKACTCPEGRCRCGKTHFADDDTIAYIARLEAELALARQALEYYADPNYNGHNANSKCAKIALSTLTTGNAVQQIEARALREAAEFVDRNLYDCRTYAEELRKLAEQKEKG